MAGGNCTNCTVVIDAWGLKPNWLYCIDRSETNLVLKHYVARKRDSIGLIQSTKFFFVLSESILIAGVNLYTFKSLYIGLF